MKFRVPAMLMCGVATSALILAAPAQAESFTVKDGETVTNTLTLNTAGDVGTVEKGGVVNVTSGDAGIEGGASGVTVINAGTVTSTGGPAIVVKSDSTVTNSGEAHGGTAGILAFGSNNVLQNTGTATGELVGMAAVGSGNIIHNSGKAISTQEVEGFGIVAIGATLIENSGEASGAVGIAATGVGTTIINSGTAIGSDIGIVANGLGMNITNTGHVKGGTAAVMMDGADTTLTLLNGSNIQGLLFLGGASNSLVIGQGLNTYLAYEGAASITAPGAQLLVSRGIAAAVDPTGFAAANEAVTDLTRMVGTAVDARLTGARHGGAGEPMAMNGMLIAPVADVPAARETVIWATGLGGYRDQQGEDAQVGFTSQLGGAALGVDHRVSDTTTVGALIGASSSTLDTDTGSQSIDSTVYFAGLYGGFQQQGHFLNVALDAGITHDDSKRIVLNNMVEGGTEQASGNYDGAFVSPSVTLGKDMKGLGGTVTPSITARYAGLFLGSYDEQGSAADLSVDSRAVHVFDMRGQVAFAPASREMENGRLDGLLRLGMEASVSSGAVDAELLGERLNFDANEERSARAFIGADAAYQSESGFRLFIGGEAGYDTDNALTAEAHAGLKLPL